MRAVNSSTLFARLSADVAVLHQRCPKDGPLRARLVSLREAGAFFSWCPCPKDARAFADVAVDFCRLVDELLGVEAKPLESAYQGLAVRWVDERGRQWLRLYEPGAGLAVGSFSVRPGSVFVAGGDGPGGLVEEVFQPDPQGIYIHGGQAPACPAKAGAAEADGDRAVRLGFVHE